MAFIFASGNPSFSSETLNVSLEPATADTLVIAQGEDTSDFSRTAGALVFVVKNIGPAGGGSQAIATVNGIDLFPGVERRFEAKLDPVNNLFKTLPAFTVVTNGATVSFYEER